jgi:hypothetical protein
MSDKRKKCLLRKISFRNISRGMNRKNQQGIKLQNVHNLAGKCCMDAICCIVYIGSLCYSPKFGYFWVTYYTSISSLSS